MSSSIKIFRITTLTLSISLLLCPVLCSQNLPPILREKPKRGIYADFKEFLNNSPSVEDDFELKPRSKSKQFWLGGSDYELILKNSQQGRKYALKFWGISTGDSIYVNVANYQVNKGYIKLQKLGRYCYLKGQRSAATDDPAGAAVGGGIVGGLITNIPTEVGYVLNINNGNFYSLNKDIMLRILANDAELKAGYLNENKRQDPDIMLQYIDKYNSRHADEIGKEKLAQLIIYRRDKKERMDTVSVLTSDSTQLDVALGDFKTFYYRNKSIDLCIGKECGNYQLVFNEVNYFECIFKQGDARPKLKPVKKEVGEYYLREIQFNLDNRKE